MLSMRTSVMIAILANLLIGSGGTAVSATPTILGSEARTRAACCRRFQVALATGLRSHAFITRSMADVTRRLMPLRQAPRPILVNIWYPAERSNRIDADAASRLFHRVQTEDPRWSGSPPNWPTSHTAASSAAR